MEFYKTKKMVNEAIDSLVKNMIAKKKVMLFNDFRMEISGRFGAGDKMIRSRLESYEVEGKIRIEKDSKNHLLDRIMSGNSEEI